MNHDDIPPPPKHVAEVYAKSIEINKKFQEMTYSYSYIAFIDILGFSNFVKKQSEDAVLKYYGQISYFADYAKYLAKIYSKEYCSNGLIEKADDFRACTKNI